MALELEFVLAHGQNLFFRELADALLHAVSECGQRATLSVGQMAEPSADRVPVIFAPHEVANFGLGELLDPRVASRAIGICAEQPGTPWFDENRPLVKLLGRVFDISPVGAAAMCADGTAARHLPLGLVPPWRAADTTDVRGVDVSFLGSESPRRVRALRELLPGLTHLRTEVMVAGSLVPLTAPSSRFITGTPKRRWLCTSKVLVNIHRSELRYFEWPRALDALHAGAVLITEPGEGHGSLEPGVHYLEAELHQLRDVVLGALDDPSRLDAIRHAGWDWLRRHPMTDSAALLVDAGASLRKVRVPTRTPVPSRSWPMVVTSQVGAASRAARDRPVHLEAWGTFDVDNLGDQLFPVVMAHALRRVGGPHAHLTLASSWGGMVPGWSKETLGAVMGPEAMTTRRLVPACQPGFAEQSGLADAVVVAGGDVIQDITVALRRDGVKLCDYVVSRIATDMPMLATRVPVGWHAVGMPSQFAEPHRQQLAAVIGNLRWCSVRDGDSAAHVQGLVGQLPVRVVPDSVWTLPDVWTLETVTDRAARMRHSGALPDGPYVAVHASFLDADAMRSLAGQLRLLSEQRVTPLLVALGPCFGDDSTLASLGRSVGIPILVGRSVPDRVAALAAAEGYLGTSLHGGVVAASYGVAVAWIRDVAKTRDAARLLGATDRIFTANEVAAVAERMLGGGLAIDPFVVQALSHRSAAALTDMLSSLLAPLLSAPPAPCHPGRRA